MTSRGLNLIAGFLAIIGATVYSCSSEKKEVASADPGEIGMGQSDSQATAAGNGGTNTVESPADASGSREVDGGGTIMSGSGGKTGETSGEQTDAAVMRIDAGVGTPDADDSGGSVDAGPPDIPCDPADQTPPPTVIEYSAKDSALFEIALIVFDPEAVTGEDTPNTGPYQPIIEVYPDFDQFTIYRPEDTDIGRLLPVIAWANGGCFQHGTFSGEFLKEIASYGFLVIADGPPGDPAVIGGPMSPADGSRQLEMIDWAIAENERPCSTFYHKLDINKIAVTGNSCGGLMTMYAAPDPRVTTAVLWNSGLFARDQPLYDSLHAPMAIFNGGPADLTRAGLDPMKCRCLSIR